MDSTNGGSFLWVYHDADAQHLVIPSEGVLGHGKTSPAQEACVGHLSRDHDFTSVHRSMPGFSKRLLQLKRTCVDLGTRVS